ncbi:type I-E CRISPR-associated protein Cse1/CasA [uncultured Thiodictyon sp.]|uniref:type I-E CRISPR-associated protein Cse1/CasA n=1 Tax=uncultured Thiodictyon sp. TaxID=1846217 RepID=UPI0025E90D2E|nr:type I-E CRISPR-associated protein Cse1/CasA [uncultured Thiodictyon sp.]
MNLLEAPWIPIRTDDGRGPFSLITYRELLCEPGTWRVSLPRDDLELACIQLLVCMTQVLFQPADDDVLDERLDEPLSEATFAAGIARYQDWFDLDHPTQPFMQTRGVASKEATPIQKLLIGLPAGNNHCFFNETGEVAALSAPIAAIALFHQASNCPSFGGGFKGSLRGEAPITTLVDGPSLREQVWRNVLTLERTRAELFWTRDLTDERPTWIDPIKAGQTIYPHQIGLIRGLFWQPAHVELIPAAESGPCDLLGIEAGPRYTGFRKEKFNFTLDGNWPHPHGALNIRVKKGERETKFASFTTDAPAWTRLTELVVSKKADDSGGNRPALAIGQAKALDIHPLHLLVGGYHNKKASVLERRHELIELGEGWDDESGRLEDLVNIGLAAKKALRGKLYFAVQGHKDKGLPGIGAAIHETGERLFYARTEARILATFSNSATFSEWQQHLDAYAAALSTECESIFNDLTDPYAMKPELIPIIAWARRSLTADLRKLTEGK